MVKSKPAGKEVIICNGCKVNIKKFYTDVKEKIEDLDFDFIEKSQEQEKNQYGGLVKVTYAGEKEVNEFVKKTMEIKMRFENIKRNNSDAKIEVVFKVHYDYKNRWDTNPIKQFLFHIYLTYMVPTKLKVKYFVPVIQEYREFTKFLKKNLGMQDK